MKPKSDCLFIIEWRGYVSACWTWQRALRNGYGYLSVGGRPENGGRRVYAHRHIYEMANGPIPSGLHIDHLCRNRACVRPDHLEPVTCTENTRRGLKAKVSQSDVVEIRKLKTEGHSSPAIAAKFGLSRQWVNDIVAERWRK